MKVLIGLMLVVLYVAGCSSEKKSPDELTEEDELSAAVDKNNDSSLTEASKYYLENTKVTFGSPITFQSTENIAIPIILEEKYEEKGMSEYSYFNIAISGKSDTIKRMLFDESVTIENLTTFETGVVNDYYNHAYTYPQHDEYDYTLSSHFDGLLFFEVHKYENREQDYCRLYVYDLISDVLTQLSFENTDVIDWHVFDGQSKIHIEYRFDSNNDGKLDDKDDENMIITDPRHPQDSKPLFDIEKLKAIKVEVANKNQLKPAN